MALSIAQRRALLHDAHISHWRPLRGDSLDVSDLLYGLLKEVRLIRLSFLDTIVMELALCFVRVVCQDVNLAVVVVLNGTLSRPGFRPWLLVLIE